MVGAIDKADSSIIFAPSKLVAQLAVKATKPGGTIMFGVWVELGEVPFPD
jgi:hypothetical protein